MGTRKYWEWKSTSHSLVNENCTNLMCLCPVFMLTLISLHFILLLLHMYPNSVINSAGIFRFHHLPHLWLCAAALYLVVDSGSVPTPNLHPPSCVQRHVQWIWPSCQSSWRPGSLLQHLCVTQHIHSHLIKAGRLNLTLQTEDCCLQFSETVCGRRPTIESHRS